MPKMGRPKLPKAKAKSGAITLRLLKHERQQLLDAAQRDGLSLSEWLRRKLTLAALPQGQAVNSAFKAWLESDEGKKCSSGTTAGTYLENRLYHAFAAGVDATLESKRRQHDRAVSGVGAD